jgi:hypothetical protein
MSGDRAAQFGEGTDRFCKVERKYNLAKHWKCSIGY